MTRAEQLAEIEADHGALLAQLEYESTIGYTPALPFETLPVMHLSCRELTARESMIRDRALRRTSRKQSTRLFPRSTPSCPQAGTRTVASESPASLERPGHDQEETLMHQDCLTTRALVKSEGRS
jgi:hypothetical protein